MYYFWPAGPTELILCEGKKDITENGFLWRLLLGTKRGSKRSCVNVCVSEHKDTLSI